MYELDYACDEKDAVCLARVIELCTVRSNRTTSDYSSFWEEESVFYSISERVEQIFVLCTNDCTRFQTTKHLKMINATKKLVYFCMAISLIAGSE